MTFGSGGNGMIRRASRAAAGVAALLFVCLSTLDAQQAAPARRPRGDAGVDYQDYEPATVERGKTSFVAQCGFCHGANAKGGESGPDLVRSIQVIDDENGNLIGPIIQGARQSKGMPKFDMPQKEIQEITAFLHTAVRSAAERGNYKILNIVTGNAKAGETYFNGQGKCNTCHSVTGNLKGVGAKYDPIALQGKVLMPVGGNQNQKRTSSPVMVTVTTPSGQNFKGTLERIDDFNVAITEAGGSFRSFARNGNVPKVELSDPVQFHFDMLPKYTDTDIHNLTAYLVTLK
jgi:mono/diheme cytochrome c family protein